MKKKILVFYWSFVGRYPSHPFGMQQKRHDNQDIQKAGKLVLLRVQVPPFEYVKALSVGATLNWHTDSDKLG
jgi:hypothetical protein